MAEVRRRSARVLTAGLLLALGLALGGGGPAGAAEEAPAAGLYDRPVLVVDPGVHTAIIKRARRRPRGPVPGHRLGRQDGPGLGGRGRPAAAHPAPAGRPRRRRQGLRRRDLARRRPGRRRRVDERDRPTRASTCSTGRAGGCCAGSAGCRTSSATSPSRPTGPGSPRRSAAAGVRLIDPAAGRVVAADEGYGDSSYGAAFDAAGRLATTSYDGKVRLYDPGLRLLRAAEAPGGKRPFGIAFSPDGGRLAVGYDDTTAVDVLDAGTLERLFAADTRGVDNGDLGSVAWSADGGSLYAAGRWQVGGECAPAPLAGGRAGRAGRPAAEPEHGDGPARAAGRAARLRRRRPAARAARRRRPAGLERGAGHRRLPRPGRTSSRSRRTGRGSASGTSTAASRRPCSRCRSAGWPRAGAPPASPPRGPRPPASRSRAGRTAPSRA